MLHVDILRDRLEEDCCLSNSFIHLVVDTDDFTVRKTNVIVSHI